MDIDLPCGLHLITIDFGHDLLETLLTEFIFFSENNIYDFSRIAFIFEGKRPALFLNKLLASKLKHSFVPPSYFTLNSFVDSLYNQIENPSTTSEMNRAYIIYQCAKDAAPEILRDYPLFSDFLPWARDISLFIEQLDAENVSDARICNFQEQANIGYDLPESINSLLKNIAVIRELYYERLIAKGFSTRSLRRKILNNRVSDVDLSIFNTVVFVNLGRMYSADMQLVKAVSSKTKSFFVVQGQPEKWGFIKKTLSAFDFISKKHIGSGEFLEPNIYLHEGFDSHSQVNIAVNVADKYHYSEDTVIILPDSDNIIPLLTEFSASECAINVSMGYPILRSSVVSLIDLIFSAQNSRKNGKYYAPDYIQLLRHPLIKNFVYNETPVISRVIIHKIEELLLGVVESSMAGALFITLDDVENSDILLETILSTGRSFQDVAFETDTVLNIMREIHFSLARIWETVSTFEDLSAALEKFCDVILEKSFVRNYSINLSVMRIIFDLIDELKMGEFTSEFFSQDELFSIFMNYIKAKRVAFSGAPIKGMQVLGVMETRALRFSNIIIMDANEGILPKLRRFMPLIPRDISRSLGFMDIAEEEELQRYHFRRLIAGSANVDIIFNAKEGMERSRFIEDYLWEKQKINYSDSTLPISSGFFKGIEYKKNFIPEKTNAIINYLSEKFVFSVTSINTYIKCPMQFYFKYVLKLDEKEGFLEDPHARDIGIFIHGVLEDLYKPMVASEFKIDEVFFKNFEKLFEERFENTFSKKMRADSCAVKNIMLNRFKNFFQSEIQRGVQQIVGLEKEYRMVLKCKNFSIPFVSKVDRIDRLIDNTILVIDYKTGAQAEFPSEVKKLVSADINSRQAIKRTVKSFQLPLYLMLVMREFPENTVDAALFYLRNNTQTVFSNKIKEDFPYKDGLEICSLALKRVTEEILDPSFTFERDENVQSCSYCPYRFVCR